MSVKSVPATAAKNRFGSMLKEVSSSGEPLIIEKDGQPVAVIMSISAYEALQPKPTLSLTEQELLDSVFGMWADRTDIDDNWLEEGRQQWESAWHDE